MVARRPTDEDGFSLTELIVVTALLGVILTISYAGLLVMYKARQVSDRQAAFAAEAGAPLTHMDKILTQAISIENPGSYSITVLTDRDNDDVLERHLFEATVDGNLRHRTWDTNMMGVNQVLTFDETWSTNNLNQDLGRDLFTYMNQNGDDIADEDLADAEIVRIQVRVWVEYDGRTYDGSREVLLRNML